MISTNWQRLVKQHSVDPINRAPPHSAKKRKVSGSPSLAARAGPPTAAPLPAPLAPPSSSLSSQPTLLLAMDCEMVGVGAGGASHCLARCSVVNSLGVVLYDRYVQAVEAVTDYRTAVSGIQPHHILPSNGAVPFVDCQRDVAALLSRRVLVGHALHSDLAALQLSHPRHLTRDTSRWKGLCPNRPRALRALADEQLGLAVQTGQHDSVEDARAALQLYMKHRKEWELSLRQQRKQHRDGQKQHSSTHTAARQRSRHDSRMGSGEAEAASRRRQSQMAQPRLHQQSSNGSGGWTSEGPVLDGPASGSDAVRGSSTRAKRNRNAMSGVRENGVR